MTQTKTDDDTTRVEEEPSASAALTDGGEKGEPVAEGEMFLIGIGASAGGLEAIRELLKNAPAEVPGAYVVVQHMSPKHKSLLRSLIDRETHLKVVDLESGMQPQENAVYVTPPRNDVVYQDGKLFLVEPSTSVASPKPSVDRFFVSLAEGAGTHAIGIILSGTGSDGAYGVQAIRGAGGTTFAQHEKTAKYDGMPLAAVNTGCVDLVMAPDEIGQHLAKLPGSLQMTGQLELSNETPDLLQELFHILHARCNVDFREYKATTVQRRIERRMAARGLADLAAYVRRCRMEPEEVDALFRDLLISVTRFFRDKTEFESLREYRRGDDPRLIDWKATARRGDLIVRRMMPETRQDVALLLDGAFDAGLADPLRPRVRRRVLGPVRTQLLQPALHRALRRRERHHRVQSLVAIEGVHGVVLERAIVLGGYAVPLA